MNEDTINDLKQFITATISQQFADVATKDDLANVATKADIARIEKKIDDLQAYVGEALDTGNEAVDGQLKDHEQRLIRLEQATAR